MKPYQPQALAQIISAEVYGPAQESIHSVSIDSRIILHGNQHIFIALKGAQKDGHSFINDAYNKGVRNFLVEKLPSEIKQDATYLKVEKTLVALQQWAAFHRKQFHYPVIGITGSNGKTVVKEWLHQLLFAQFKIVRSPKSYNSQIGVPLSVLEMGLENDLAIFEVGISQPNEMENLQKIVQPTIGVLTNVGTAHSSFFKDRKEHITEKICLLKNVETAVLPNDDKEIYEVYEELAFPNQNLVSWGENAGANIQIKEITLGENETLIEVEIDLDPYQILIPFTTQADILNAVNCLAVIYTLGLNVAELIPKFSQLQPVEMRLELKEGVYGSLIINDAFNSDLSSLPNALHLLDHQKKEKKTIILTDVLQNRLPANELYPEVANMVNSFKIQKVILIGDEIPQYASLFKNFAQAFKNTDDFFTHYNQKAFKDQAILLKGARIFSLEKISKWLEKKSHATVLEVNLQHLYENVNYFRSKLKSETKLMGMVKAFGYGTGGLEVAKVLEEQRADYLGVAYSDEGIDLRKAGIKTPIMVMNPEQNSYSGIIDFNLEPEIYSFRVLNLFTQALIDKNIPKAYKIHIKLDTGMHRLGFQQEDIVELAQQLQDNPYVKVVSIFSHLAVSDVPHEQQFTEKQFETFKTMYNELSNRLEYNPIAHILNSEGILNYPDFQLDMVRLGIGMYGIAHHETDKKHLKNVATFKTVISQIRTIQKGDTVSYGRRFKAEKQHRIATLPVGYADGISRLLSNGKGEVSIHGKLAPIVGTICMDMLMVDISEIDCEEGDEVIIFGDNPTLEQVADQSQTIPYEILTSISGRVKRVYLVNN